MTLQPLTWAKPSTDKIRRSWLLVPVSNDERIERAHLAGADVVVLDLVEFVAERDKPLAREKVAVAIERVKTGGAEVFAQVDPELLYADLRGCVWPGLAGIVISRVESPGQVADAHDILGQLEEERGVRPHSIEVVGSLETAQGNVQGYDIGVESPRIWGLTLGRADLMMDLRPEPSGEIHLMQYLMQRLVMLANAVGVAPLGAWWQGTDRGLLASPEKTYRAAFKGRAIGFKGSFCVNEDQVEPLNQGFSPNDVEVTAAHGLLQAYENGIARGAATIRMNERFVDRGAAAQARLLIEFANKCAARDKIKTAALEGQPIPT